MSICYDKNICKVINFFLRCFLLCSAISTVYVFTYPFTGQAKIFLFVASIFLILITFHFFKEKINKIIENLIERLSRLSIKEMIFIIIFVLLFLKVIATCFFYFDPTTEDGDITIYSNIAKSIAHGELNKRQISHLIGIGYHLAVFDYLKIPYHIGIFAVFFIGTIVNFISFEKILGKEKSFLIIMLYLFMPSTILLTFCPTHELFVYFYLSVFFCLFNRFLLNEMNLKNSPLLLFLALILFLINFVSPIGKVLYIILALVIVFSNTQLVKKGLIVFIVLLSLLISSGVNNSLELDDTSTKLNTYYILVRGSSIETNGEHVDGYTNKKIKEYYISHNMDDNRENELIAIKDILLDQYKYLFTHPIEALKLLAHKFYVTWSGNHYSIEMAYHYKGINNLLYYLFLGISAFIYLAVIALALFFWETKNDDICISNYKLLVLGVAAVLLISLVLNKYSVYATAFIFCICFYQIHLEK